MNKNETTTKNRIIKEYTFGTHIIKLEQVADVNKLVDQITDDEFNQDERLPYWAEVWPSAQAMSDYILKNQNKFKNKKILELGCGIGLVGIAATFAGANVTFSDYENEALEFTQNNYFINFGKQAKTYLLDWRKPNLKKQFDIIIAADILYEKRFLLPVHDTIRRMLLSGGNAYIAEPDRTVAKPFFKLMENGFQLDNKMSINIQLDKIISVSIYVFTKC